MKGQKPVKLYYFLTFLLIFLALVIGFWLRDYLSQKFPEHPPELNETKPEKGKSELDFSLAIVNLALKIALVLILIFVILKIIIDKLKKS